MAIDYLGSLLPGGWPALMAQNRALAREARDILCAAAGTPPVCPDEMVGSIASVRLPDSPLKKPAWRQPDPLQPRLFGELGHRGADHALARRAAGA